MVFVYRKTKSSHIQEESFDSSPIHRKATNPSLTFDQVVIYTGRNMGGSLKGNNNFIVSD